MSKWTVVRRCYHPWLEVARWARNQLRVSKVHSMTLETGYLSSRQVIDQSNGCQASGFATGRAARQISKRGVHREGHVSVWARKF